jgi:Ran GTPase-activating protein (RanGAP) involved in mRNA processing and transport
LLLNGNDIGNLGIEPLCKALSERETKLTNLDVGNNGIGHEAGIHIADYIKVGLCTSRMQLTHTA